MCVVHFVHFVISFLMCHVGFLVFPPPPSPPCCLHLTYGRMTPLVLMLCVLFFCLFIFPLLSSSLHVLVAYMRWRPPSSMYTIMLFTYIVYILSTAMAGACVFVMCFCFLCSRFPPLSPHLFVASCLGTFKWWFFSCIVVSTKMVNQKLFKVLWVNTLGCQHQLVVMHPASNSKHKPYHNVSANTCPQGP